MNQFRKITICCVLTMVFLSFSACNDNLTLEEYQLGNGRRLRIKTDVRTDISMPIHYEMYADDSLIQDCYLFSAPPQREKFREYKFQLVSDKAKNIFALIPYAPVKEQVAIFDFSTGFKYPCCGGYSMSDCKNEYNRLAAILEQDNPELKLERKVNYY